MSEVVWVWDFDENHYKELQNLITLRKLTNTTVNEY